jgi:phosphonate metabolism protein PhnN/1,5-bisphosphokinase (PRPP-forming)
MLVMVVGPSGAGKDTLLNAAKAALNNDPKFVFPKRVITRPSVAELEDHESVTEAEFAVQQANGAYALSWDAHGLHYALPAALADDLKANGVVVINGSRAAIAAAKQRFPATRVILIEASPEVRAKRLAGRGRETEAEIADRLTREVPDTPADAIRIDNSGPLEVGVASFVAALRSIARA